MIPYQKGQLSNDTLTTSVETMKRKLFQKKGIFETKDHVELNTVLIPPFKPVVMNNNPTAAPIIKPPAK